MRKLSLLSILSVIMVLNVASMCSNDDDPVAPVSANPTPVINTVKDGTWRITYFYDTDTDETANFTGYIFTFGNGNVLTASNGANTYNGAWSVTNSDIYDDNPSNDLDFNISFVAPPNFEELSDDWDILERTATKVRLVDVSGGNGGTDYLTFEKN